MRLCVTLSVLLAQAVAALAQERLPIIDMHMHASSLRRDVDGVPLRRPCNLMPCEGPPAQAKSTADVLKLTLEGSSPNFPVKSPYGSPGSVKLLVPPTCFWGGTRFEVPRFS